VKSIESASGDEGESQDERLEEIRRLEDNLRFRAGLLHADLPRVEVCSSAMATKQERSIPDQTRRGACRFGFGRMTGDGNRNSNGNVSRLGESRIVWTDGRAMESSRQRALAITTTRQSGTLIRCTLVNYDDRNKEPDL
jgi:hypothetical protein